MKPGADGVRLRLLASSAGLKATLAVVEYTAKILHYVSAASPSLAFRRRLRQLLLSKLRGSPLSAAAPAPNSSSALLAFAGVISETRISLRLLSLVSIWTWGSSTFKSPPKDCIIRAIVYLQILSLAAFQVLENVTYLAAKGAGFDKLLKRFGGFARWSLWSTRAWCAYIMLELLRLVREAVLFRQRDEQRRKLDGQSEKAPSSLADVEAERARQLELRSWKKSLVTNLAWAPVSVHGSVQDGIGVPPFMIAVLGLTATAWGAYDLWLAA